MWLTYSRRHLLGLLGAAVAVPQSALARTAQEITWDDLVPPGVPYSEIIGEGEMDEVNDTWRPIFDENARKLNETLDGKYIKMPGFVLPLDIAADGIRDFLLVPYVGACIHVPPPPPNQLVLVKSKVAWPSDSLWDAVWVTGTLHTKIQDTDIAETGYHMRVDAMELYEW